MQFDFAEEHNLKYGFLSCLPFAKFRAQFTSNELSDVGVRILLIDEDGTNKKTTTIF